MTKGYYRFPVGSFACTCLSDGGKEYPIRELFSDAPEKEVRTALQSNRLDPDEPFIPYTHLHVDTGDHQILVDTGAGKLFPTTGLLRANMEAAEIDPAEIDTVIITHAHPDHVGGMMLDDRTLAYPNAAYVIDRREWSHWFSDAARGSSGEYSWFVEFARKNLEPVRQRVHFVDFSAENEALYSGVSLWRAPGHTPGHVVVALESTGDKLLYIGDAVITPIHLEHPAWLPIFDVEPASAAASKRFIFDLAAELNCWVIGQHFSPFPGLGHVVRRADGWQWSPIEVAN